MSDLVGTQIVGFLIDAQAHLCCLYHFQKRPTFLPEYKNPCWLENGKLKCINYFQLFGICKSGTSDFFKRLLLHPGIVPNRGIFGKEIWYWSWKRLQHSEFYFIIRKTCPCNKYPLIHHFHIVKLGYAGVYLFFLFLLQNIDCGYSLEPPQRGGSNVYPQSMF